MQRKRVVLRERGANERPQLLFVLGTGDDHARQLALAGNREHSLMAGSVLTYEAGAVHCDYDRQIVLAHVVDFLVEGALQESGVQGHDRPLARQSHPRGEGNRMLLRDPYVDEAIRELGLEEVQPGASGHARGHGHDPAIQPRQVDQLASEVVRVVGRPL